MPQTLPYSQLLSTLSLASVPELEEALIDLFYQNVLTGRLDQKHSRLEVVTLSGRDVRPDLVRPHDPSPDADNASTTADTNAMQVDPSAPTRVRTRSRTRRRTGCCEAPSVASLHSTLASWHRTLHTLTRALEFELGSVHAEAVNAAAADREHEHRVRAVVEAVVVASGGGGKKGNAAVSAAVGSSAKNGSLPAAAAAAAAGGRSGGWDAVSTPAVTTQVVATTTTAAAAHSIQHAAGTEPGEGEGEGEGDGRGKMMDVDDENSNHHHAAAAAAGDDLEGGPTTTAAAATAAAAGHNDNDGGGGGSGLLGRTRKRGRI